MIAHGEPWIRHSTLADSRDPDLRETPKPALAPTGQRDEKAGIPSPIRPGLADYGRESVDIQ